MVQKYIIDKTDIHDLLTGKEIPLPQCRARAFCVEIAGKITNGDMIMALFPDCRESNIDYDDGIAYTYVQIRGTRIRVTCDWWNAPYKAEREE